MRNLSALTKTRVTTTRVANAFTGYATGILIAGDIECIVITATREHAQAFMDQNNTVPGDANHWSMLTDDGKWLLAILANGEQTSERQVHNFRRLAACWNACDGFATDDLEACPPGGLVHLAAHTDQLAIQRDDLLAAMSGLLMYFESGNSVPVEKATIKASSQEVQAARAVIARVKGGAV